MQDCTVYNTLDIVAKKWSLLIILSIYKGDKDKKRYSEIKRDLKEITPKILSQRLKELEADKIIKKTIDYKVIPVNTYYELTPSGKDLVKIINDIKKWGLEHKFKNKECQATFCKNCKF